MSAPNVEGREVRDSVARWTVRASRASTFDIVRSTGVFDVDNPVLHESLGLISGHAASLVVIDDNVDRLYGANIRRYLTTHGIKTRQLTLLGGEPNKTMSQVDKIVRALNRIDTLRRSTPMIGIGGGVVLDVVGLAAALFRRGIPYIRVPTTLLSQVDVSVAAKTGVNFGGYRNRLGTYNPPRRTIIDSSLLASVPERQLRSGLGEIIKLALIRDDRLFDLVDHHGQQVLASRFQSGHHANEIMERAIDGMVHELEPDLWEDVLQRPTDYGHTFSPLFEMRAVPHRLHGEAVAMDCLFSAVIAKQRGLLTARTLDRIAAVTGRLGLLQLHSMFTDPDFLWAALADVTRHRDGMQNLPLLKSIGSVCFVSDLTLGEIARAAAEFSAVTARSAVAGVTS